jgi:hypothetical protein
LRKEIVALGTTVVFRTNQQAAEVDSVAMQPTTPFLYPTIPLAGLEDKPIIS